MSITGVHVDSSELWRFSSVIKDSELLVQGRYVFVLRLTTEMKTQQLEELKPSG